MAENEVAVLGMKKKFQSDAQNKFQSAIVSSISPADEIYKFLNDSIDAMKQTGSKKISKPTFYIKLNRGKITQKGTNSK